MWLVILFCAEDPGEISRNWLAHLTVLNVLVQLGFPILNQRSMCRVNPSNLPRRHLFQRVHIFFQILENRSSVSQHTIPCEKRFFFFQVERQVVGTVAGRVDGDEGGAGNRDDAVVLERDVARVRGGVGFVGQEFVEAWGRLSEGADLVEASDVVWWKKTAGDKRRGRRVA